MERETTPPWRTDRAFLVCFGLLLVGSASLFWLFDYLPLQDLPQHLALNTALAHLGDRSSSFARYYELDLRAWPYFVFRAFNAGLGLLVTPLTALRVFLTIYALLLPIAALRWLAALRRDHWLALLSFPLVWNTNLHWGFLSFCLGAALLMLALAEHERRLDAGRGTICWPQSALGVLLFLTHAQAFAAWALSALLLTACDRRYRIRAALTDLAPALVLMGVWLLLVAGGERAEFGLQGARWLSLAASWELFEHALFLASNYGPGLFWERLFIVGFGALYLGLVLGSWRQLAAPGPARLAALRYLVVTAAFVALYFAAPYAIGGQFYVAPRMLLFAALAGLALVEAPLDGALARYLVRPLLIAIALSYLALNAWLFHEFQARVGAFDRALASIPRGQRVLPMAFAPSLRFVKRMELSHFGGYYVARRGGLVPFGWHSNGVRVKPRWHFWPADWIQYRFSYAHFGRYFQYYLFRDPGRFGHPHPLLGTPRDRVELVFRSPHWEVWRNRTPVDPPTPKAAR